MVENYIYICARDQDKTVILAQHVCQTLIINRQGVTQYSYI